MSERKIYITLGKLLNDLGEEGLDKAQTNLYFYVGGDLIDMASLQEENYVIKYKLPGEMSTNLKFIMAIQSANKVNQRIYRRVGGFVKDLIEGSTETPATLFLKIDENARAKELVDLSTVRENVEGSYTQKIFAFTTSAEDAATQQFFEAKRVEINHDDHSSVDETDSDVSEVENLVAHEDFRIQDTRYLMPSSMPSWLRIDKDIREGLLKVSKLTNEYSSFDVNTLDHDTTRILELELDKQSAQYKAHKYSVGKKLENAIQKVEDCIVLKNDGIVLRQKKQVDLLSTFEVCRAFQAREREDQKELQEIRGEVLVLNKELRRAYNITSAADIDGARLTAIQEAERDLAQIRHEYVLFILELALRDVDLHIQLLQQRAQITQVDLENLAEAQKKMVAQQFAANERFLNLRGILTDKIAKFLEETAQFKADFSVIKSENAKLRAQKDASAKQVATLQANFAKLSEAEKTIRAEWDQQLQEIKDAIARMRAEIAATLQTLADGQITLSEYAILKQTYGWKIQLQDKVRAMFVAAKFEEREQKLLEEIEFSKSQREQLTAELQEIKTEWLTYYEEQLTQLKLRLEEIDNAALLKILEEQAEEVKAQDAEMDALCAEIQGHERDLESMQSTGSDEGLARAKKEAEAKLIRLRTLLNKKTVLYAELMTNARMLMDYDDQMVLNEEEKLRLTQDIDVGLLKLLQKRQLAVELADQLAEKKEEYKALKQYIKELDARCEHLKQELKEKDDELDQNNELLMIKNLEIEQLVKDTGEEPPVFDEYQDTQQQDDGRQYRPVKGDLVDELAAKEINTRGTDLPILRLGDGFYLFGTRRIQVKATGGKLMVKAQGGLSSFGEFIETHDELEIAKVNDLIKKGQWDQQALAEYHQNELNPTPSKTGRGSVTASNMRKSGASPTANRNSPRIGSTAAGNRASMAAQKRQKEW